MALSLLVGAAIGAGVGSYGADNWGWSKDAIWQGGIAGGIGGSMYGGAGGAPAGDGGIGGSFMGPPTASAMGPPSAAAGSAGGGFSLTNPLMPGQAWSSPLMLGAAGMNLMAGSSASAPAFQDKVELSEKGKALQTQWVSAIKGNVKKAKAGDVGAKAAGDIHRSKLAEGNRNRQTTGAINTVQAMVGNRKPDQRGYAAGGGQVLKSSLMAAGERMEGLFAPTSILNNYRKEEILNAAKQLSNVQNIENQVGAQGYSSSLASYSANQMLSAQKGAAYGSTAAMMGGFQRGQAHLNQQNAYMRSVAS